MVLLCCIKFSLLLLTLVLVRWPTVRLKMQNRTRLDGIEQRVKKLEDKNE
jgi:hypothetical protein